MLVPGEELYEFIDRPVADAIEPEAAADQQDDPSSATTEAARANKKQRIQAFQCEVMRKVQNSHSNKCQCHSDLMYCQGVYERTTYWTHVTAILG